MARRFRDSLATRSRLGTRDRLGGGFPRVRSERLRLGMTTGAVLDPNKLAVERLFEEHDPDC